MINIYKASAGSGKTHTLTKDYLFLAFKNPMRFKNILAVTFTNKAAGEMKERIIEELSILANTPEKSDFIDDIKVKFKKPLHLIKFDANIILKKILHNYTFFNISTIDSFVQKVIRAFAFELRIPASYKIELDGEKVSTDLTDIVLSNLNENKNLQKWLTSYAYERMSEGRKWNFRQNIINFSSQLFNEKFYGFFDETKISQEDFDVKLNDFSSKIYASINYFEIEIKKQIKKGIGIIKKSGIDSVAGNKIKYLRNFFYSNENKINLEINATLKTAIEEDDFWTKSTKEFIKSQWNDTIESLRNIALDIFEFEQENGKDYYTAIKIKNNLYTFGVINNLKNQLPEYRDENNIMLIIDLTLMLNKIIGENEAPFIYEKIGNRYTNIMIDEFQDTSEFQWNNFRPLILNSLATNNYNLIVGDVKQSIYRWRNGDWRLLHSGVKKEIDKNLVEETTLGTNWRSKKEIVNFNNAIFSRLPFLMQQKANKDFADVKIPDELSNLLPNAYDDTYQKIAPKNQEGGYVRFEFLTKDNDIDEKTNDSILNLVEELLLKYSPGDIAILVRRNSEANAMMKLLLDYSANKENPDEQFNVISAESLLLSNSFAIRIIINIFKYILNTDDSIFLIEIISDFNRLKNSNIGDYNVFNIRNLDETKGVLPQGFIDYFDKLKYLSLFELTEKIISLFEMTTFDSEIPFIRSFEELVSSFVQNKGSDLKSFVNFWDEKQHKFSVQLSEIKNAMQVMTLHKSKGLAFNIVIMPFVNWKLDPMHTNIIWGNTHNTKFNDFPFLPINTTKDLSKTHFSDDYIDEKLYSFMDAINMLYVAFTRAKERLYGFVPIPKKINGGTIGEQIYEAFNQSDKILSYNEKLDLVKLEEFFNKENNIFELGNDEIIENDSSIISEDEKERKNIFEFNSYPAFDWSQNIAIVTHSEDLIAETVETRKTAIKQGILMHELFSHITTYKDINSAIEKMLKNGKISPNDAEIIKIDIDKLFENKQIKSWFDEGWEVFAEKEILTKYGDTKIPDRVISNDEEVIVIDYKFGNKRPEHKRQVTRYLNLLEDIEKNKKYSGFLLYADVNEVVEV